MSEADEIQLPWSLLIKISMWIETLHLSASLTIFSFISFLLSFSAARNPTVYRSQSTLSPQAPGPYKLEYLNSTDSSDLLIIILRECIPLDFTVVKHKSCCDQQRGGN